MALFQKKKPEAPKEFNEEDYAKEKLEETSIKEENIQEEEPKESLEEKQVPVKLTEQDILALAKWHIARGFELLNLIK